MKNKLLSLVVGAALSMPTLTYAVGLGSVVTYSHLNERLSAEIPILSVRQKGRMTVTLAPNSEFQKHNMVRDEVLNDLRFEIQERKGRYYVIVKSNKQIAVPYLNFILQLNTNEGTVSRDYAIFLDPVSDKKKVSATSNQDISAYRKARERHAAGVATKETTPTAVAVSSQQAGQYGPVRPGETMWSIASHTRPSENIPVREMIRAIKQANPGVLAGGLPAGVILKIPTFEGFAAYSGGYAPMPVIAEKKSHAPSKPRKTHKSVAKKKATPARPAVDYQAIEDEKAPDLTTEQTAKPADNKVNFNDVVDTADNTDTQATAQTPENPTTAKTTGNDHEWLPAVESALPDTQPDTQTDTSDLFNDVSKDATAVTEKAADTAETVKSDVVEAASDAVKDVQAGAEKATEAVQDALSNMGDLTPPNVSGEAVQEVAQAEKKSDAAADDANTSAVAEVAPVGDLAVASVENPIDTTTPTQGDSQTTAPEVTEITDAKPEVPVVNEPAVNEPAKPATQVAEQPAPKKKPRPSLAPPPKPEPSLVDTLIDYAPYVGGGIVVGGGLAYALARRRKKSELSEEDQALLNGELGDAEDFEKDGDLSGGFADDLSDQFPQDIEGGRTKELTADDDFANEFADLDNLGKTSHFDDEEDDYFGHKDEAHDSKTTHDSDDDPFGFGDASDNFDDLDASWAHEDSAGSLNYDFSDAEEDKADVENKKTLPVNELDASAFDEEDDDIDNLLADLDNVSFPEDDNSATETAADDFADLDSLLDDDLDLEDKFLDFDDVTTPAAPKTAAVADDDFSDLDFDFDKAESADSVVDQAADKVDAFSTLADDLDFDTDKKADSTSALDSDFDDLDFNFDNHDDTHEAAEVKDEDHDAFAGLDFDLTGGDDEIAKQPAAPAVHDDFDDLNLSLDALSESVAHHDEEPAVIDHDNLVDFDTSPVEPVVEEAVFDIPTIDAPSTAADLSQEYEAEHQRVQEELHKNAVEMAAEETESDAQMKLDLANAFVSIAEYDRARTLLEEVISKGSPEQVEHAKALLEKANS